MTPTLQATIHLEDIVSVMLLRISSRRTYDRMLGPNRLVDPQMPNPKRALTQTMSNP